MSAAGAANPFGFPSYYEDSTGLQVALCIEDPGCPASPPASDMTAPDGEAFYQLANGTVTGSPGDALPNAQVTVDFNVEAAYLGDVSATDQITFGRIQFTARNLQPNATYTVFHPYGTSTFTVGANGDLVGGARAAQREEVGCPATPCDFNAAFGTAIGPFLRSTSAPAGYLGNGVSETTVTGGPVRNTLSVTGPGLPGLVGLSTDKFVVEGKLFDPNAPVPVPPPPVEPDGDRDGVIDRLDQCLNQVGPASNFGCPLPVVIDNTQPSTVRTITTTILQVVPVAGNQGVAGVVAAPLSVRGLSLSRRIALAQLRARGLSASMRLQDGTRVVRIAVYRARNGRKRGAALFRTTRAVTAAGALRVTLRNRVLRNLRAGQYVMEVRAGRSSTTLGRVSRVSFRVTG